MITKQLIQSESLLKYVSSNPTHRFIVSFSQMKANIANLQDRMGVVESSAGIKGAPPPPAAGGTGAGGASVAKASLPGTDVTNRSKPAQPSTEENVGGNPPSEQPKAEADGNKTGDGGVGQTPRDGPRGKRRTPREKPGGTRSRVSQGSKGADQGTKSRGRRPSRVSKQDGAEALSDRASLQSSALPGLADSDHVENK